MFVDEGGKFLTDNPENALVVYEEDGARVVAGGKDDMMLDCLGKGEEFVVDQLEGCLVDLFHFTFCSCDD